MFFIPTGPMGGIVVGKSLEEVLPATYTLPSLSRAMAAEVSSSAPPKNVDHNNSRPPGPSFATNASEAAVRTAYTAHPGPAAISITRVSCGGCQDVPKSKLATTEFKLRTRSAPPPHCRPSRACRVPSSMGWRAAACQLPPSLLLINILLKASANSVLE